MQNNVRIKFYVKIEPLAFILLFEIWVYIFKLFLIKNILDYNYHYTRREMLVSYHKKIQNGHFLKPLLTSTFLTYHILIDVNIKLKHLK